MKIDYQYLDPLLEQISYMSAEDIEEVKRAYAIAYEGHDGQTRSSGQPYITHPVAVAGILADLKVDRESIQAALLHDTIEDTKFTSEDLRKLFGQSVTTIVEGVTKLDKLKFRTRQEAEVANFRKMILAMTKDVRVVLIKLADRTHNMRTLGSLRPDKQRRIAQETLDVYSTLAYRLGIVKMRLELDDLSFKAIYPLRYQLLADAYAKALKVNKNVIDKIIREITLQLQALGIKATVKAEPVPLFTIYRRMERKTQKFDSILDVCRFIIITENSDACYRALGCIHSLFKPVPGTFQDLIALPKINGYQSLHTELVTNSGDPLEVYIRTEAMAEIAELGIVSSLTYVTNSKNQEGRKRIDQWLQSLAELQQSSVNSIEFNNTIKEEICPDDVFVFTPRGKIIELPLGSTALDFAYYIHSNVGIHALKAEVDGKEVPLHRLLRNGQTVKIITDDKAYPVEEDLSKVKSVRARTRMKEALKDRQLEQYVFFGRQTLERSYQGNFSKVSKEAIEKALVFFNLAKLEDLLVEISLGNIISPVAKMVIDSYERQEEGLDNSNILQELQKGIAYSDLSVKDLKEIGHNVKVDNNSFICPNDDIFITADHGKGLVVHHKNSKAINNQRLTPYQHIRVNWGYQEYPSLIRIAFTFSKGTESLQNKADQVVNCIKKVHFKTFRALYRVREINNAYFLQFELNVKNQAHLEDIKDTLKSHFPDYLESERTFTN